MKKHTHQDYAILFAVIIMEHFMLALLVVTTGILYWIWQKIGNEGGKKLPPGPRRLPIFGNFFNKALDDSKYIYETYTQLASIYGPVVFLKNGFTNTVVVNGYKDCKKIFSHDEFLEKVDDKILLLRLYGKRIGIVYGELNLWKASRRFTVRNLRDYGFGKKDNMEVFIRREIDELKRSMDKAVTEKDGMFCATHVFDVPALNIVWAYITGTRYQHDDPQVHKLVEGITEMSNALGFDGGILNAFPFLFKILPPSILGLHHLDEIMGIFRSEMEQLIADYRLKGTYKSEPENFVEQYLQHIDLARGGEIPDPDKIFTDQNLVCILYDLFWAGSDTTSITISYAILWLTINQDAQTKWRKELKCFMAQNNRLPTINDRPHLPYTRATILEVHRRSHIVPLGTRKVYVKTAYEDYVIPKNTAIMVNYHSFMMDEKHWGDPHNFRPERFLDSENQIINSEHVIPFGLGKRGCMGETVAETSVFLFLTFLFSRYEFHPTVDKYNTDPIFGVVQAPAPFTVKMKFTK